MVELDGNWEYYPLTEGKKKKKELLRKAEEAAIVGRSMNQVLGLKK